MQGHAGISRRSAAIALASGLFAPAARAEWNADRLPALPIRLRESPHIRAFLMQKGESPPFLHYRADTTGSTPLAVASVTKSITALLVGIAIERGAISSVDEPLAAFFPEHANGAHALAVKRVTLRHLLTLSPGFEHEGLDANTDYPDFLQRLYAPGLLDHALARRLVGEPGRHFYYSNIDAHLVAVAVSRRIERPLAEFARDELFAPLGIRSADWAVGQAGVPDGAAGLRMTAPDMLRIGRMMLKGGMHEGRPVVPRAFVKEATTKQVDSDQPTRGPKELWGYGFLWWLASTPGDNFPAFYAAGYGGQFIYVVPALDLVVVALTEQVSRDVAGRTAATIRDFALPAAR